MSLSGPRPIRTAGIFLTVLTAFACADGGTPDGGSPDEGAAGPREETRAGQSGGQPGDPSQGSQGIQGPISEAELGGIDPDDINLVLRWTTNPIVAETQSDRTPARTIRSVTYGTVPGADRMTIEFEEDGPLPSHVVESFVRPLPHCTGGDTVRSQGPGLLRVRIPNVSADSAAAGVPFPPTELGNVTSIHLTCVRETLVEWVLDVQAATAYRVLHLSSPTRLVVDVRQPVEGASGGAAGEATGDAAEATTEDPAGG